MFVNWEPATCPLSGRASHSSTCIHAKPVLRQYRLLVHAETTKDVLLHRSSNNSVDTADADPAARFITRRCAAAAAVACTVLGMFSCRPALAENGPLPKTCSPSNIAPGGEAMPPGVLPYTDPMGRFRLVRPCGWSRVTTLMPESSVLASFYNPEEPGAETLAVYLAPAPEGVSETRQLGSPQEVAVGLASIAPNGIVMDAFGTVHGGRDYAVAHVQFGGNTAGVFGAAREFRAITISEGVQYTLRITTTRYRYLALPQVQQLMAAVAGSFELLV